MAAVKKPGCTSLSLRANPRPSSAARIRMTPGIGLALGAMLCFGIGDLIYKRAAAAGAESALFIMLQAWVYCPSITLYAWLTGTLRPDAAALWGSLAGFFSFTAFYN